MASYPGISPQRKVDQKSCIQVPYQFPGCTFSTACWWHNQAQQPPQVFLTVLFQEEVIVVWFTLSSHQLVCSFAHPGYIFLLFYPLQTLCYSYPPPLLCSPLLFLFLWPTPPPPTLSLPDYGTIRKVLSPLNQSTGSCLLEEIELFPPRKRQPIRSLLILHSRSELYVGVRDQVIKIPLKRCSYHKSREWVCAQTNIINLNGNCQEQICTQWSFKAPPFTRCSLSEKARPVCWSGVFAEI